MTREERENAIRHINSACDVDEWAQKAAEEALSVDWEAIFAEIKKCRITEAAGSVEHLAAAAFNTGLSTASEIIRKRIKAAKGGE